ncbi:MAG TPA: hypothetical protein VIL84_07280 [Devosiaceae bacterium]
MLTGPDALKSLDDAIRDVRREESDISQKLARNGELIARIRENEAELFRQLAQFRLTAEGQAEITGRLSQAETRARDMLAEHARSLADHERQLKALDKTIAGLATERAALLKELDKHQADLKALSARIAAVIAKDPKYEEERKNASELQSVAARSLQKTEQAETDREEKGRPYRDDPLFMYLWEAGYGTRNYKANNLIRWLDGIVARMCGFDKARPNFAMLNEIPLRLREHAERQQALAEAAEAELDRMETEAIDTAGGKPIREALVATQERIEALDAEIVKAEDDRDEAAGSLRHLAQGRDPAFTDAVGLLAQSLEREDIAKLLADARATRTAEDDAILAKIDDARLRLNEEQAEADDYHARLKVLAARRRELEDIEWEFKRARYDDPRSTFREENLAGDVLNQFLRGAITAAAYWAMWKASQGWKPGSSDWGGGVGLPRSGRTFRMPPGGGFPLPPFGGSSGSGGFNRPRSGTRGTRKTGGFKTGGGF